jgi:hypothetical protein
METRVISISACLVLALLSAASASAGDEIYAKPGQSVTASDGHATCTRRNPGVSSLPQSLPRCDFPEL